MGLIFLAVSCCCGSPITLGFMVLRPMIQNAFTDNLPGPANNNKPGSGKIETPQNEEQLAIALAATRDGDRRRRREAFEALARAPVIEGRRKEVADSALDNVREPHVDEPARNTLRKWAGKESVPGLLLLLDDNDGGIRHLALDLLGKLKDGRAAEPITLRLRVDRDQASKARCKTWGPWRSLRC